MRQIMKIFATFIVAAVFALLMPVLSGVTGGMAMAQENGASNKPSPFAAPGGASAQPNGTTVSTSPGMIDRAWNWILTQQSAANRQMAAAVKDLKTGNAAHATLVLVMISFLYGVLHAAGPGHGKAVISSYVLANEETVRRGIALSFLAALFQALSAIIFVGILAIVLNQTSMQMRKTEALVETLSWGLVAAVGAWMLYKQFKVTWPTPIAVQAGHAHHHDHAHHNHGHHDHGPNCNCGHSHMPAPQDLQGAWSWSKALPLAMSVGIRPCTGALLLLIFAMSQGLLWAGILGTFAMALGTAITVSILAALAVYSRDFAERMSGEGSPWAYRIHTAAGFAGAGLVFLLGASFFVASLKGPSPL
jgi:nickel/cobalt transporter (NicO) family protein